MTPESVQKAFACLEYQRDRRKFPDESRQGQFRAGWEDATKRERVYTDVTLNRLTWRNLGYRLGQHFGAQMPKQVDGAFEILARLYKEQASQNSAPSPDQYVSVFRKLGNFSDTQIQMLRLHYNAPERTITATEMAHAAGYSHYSIANSQYGRLGRMVGDQLEYNPVKERLGTLVTFQKRQGEWHWIMRPQVAEALERLGWVEDIATLLPEEIATAAPLVEGAVCRVTVNAYERNPEARRRCIEAHGTSCVICGFRFGETYGEAAEGFIHVHHLRPLSDVGCAYVVDPVNELLPVCPNCHAIIHHGGQLRSIEEVQLLIAQQRR